MNPSSQAAASQISGGYAVDVWMDIKLQPMMKLWQGMGGSSNFFFSEEDARQARGSYEGSDPFAFAETLWRMAQVQPNPTLGFRQGIREFVVDMPAPAAVGVCLANTGLGSGTVLQYYIPDWERALYVTGRDFQFSSKSY